MRKSIDNKLVYINNNNKSKKKTRLLTMHLTFLF